MSHPKKIAGEIYQVGGPGLTDSSDCMVYLLKGMPSILIDAGAGPSAGGILDLVKKAGCDPRSLGYLILTHGHIDHIGGAGFIKEACPTVRLVAHRGDLKAITGADPVKTAAIWYGVTPSPLAVDIVMEGQRQEIKAEPAPLVMLHTPGHTPGSCVGLADREGCRILFGQDIHGPFMREFGSDILRWKTSMERLLELNADILCEGHYGIIHGRRAVEAFIRQQLKAHGF